MRLRTRCTRPHPHVWYPYCALIGVSLSVEDDRFRRISADLDDGRDIPWINFGSFELVYRELIVLETTLQLSPIQQLATANVRNCLSTLRSL